MASRRKALEKARIKAGFSQEKLAEKLGTSRQTIGNWENAATEPYPEFIGALCQLFGREPDELLEITEEPDEGTASKTIIVSTMQNFITMSPTRQFWHIAHTDYLTYHETTMAIQAAIKDMTMMTGDDLTRREALCELASIPLISLGRNTALKPTKYEEMLRFCTAALEGCWELYRGSDTEAAKHGFECAATYLPLLEMIARNSLQLRKQALDLASQYAIVKTMLGWKFLKRTESIGHAQYALGLSKESGNILLQCSAWSKLSYTLITAKNYKAALKTMQQGEFEIKEYRRKGRGPILPSGMIGNFYSGYAAAQVHNGLDPDISLKIAVNSEPMDCVALVEFAADGQAMETAQVYSLKGDTEQALKWLGHIVDPDTLAPRALTQSDYERYETLNILVGTLLAREDKDMGHIMCAWTRTMEWAQTNQKEVLYDGAILNFARMQALWPGEDAIRRLMPLTSHW